MTTSSTVNTHDLWIFYRFLINLDVGCFYFLEVKYFKIFLTRLGIVRSKPSETSQKIFFVVQPREKKYNEGTKWAAQLQV